VVSERGVRHGRLVTVPVEFENQKHGHGAEPPPASSPPTRTGGELAPAMPRSSRG
jgi:hypothetical protein